MGEHELFQSTGVRMQEDRWESVGEEANESYGEMKIA